MLNGTGLSTTAARQIVGEQVEECVERARVLRVLFGNRHAQSNAQFDVMLELQSTLFSTLA
jgi:hypothetical protein